MKLLIFLCFTGALSAQTQPHLKKGLYAVFDTSEGTITAELYEKYVPKAVRNFVGLAEGTKPWRDPKTGEWVKRPMYNGITFHRIVREEMIQTGDPTGRGDFNCGVKVPDEFLPGLRFDRPGRLGVANSGQPDSGGCQFFITDQGVSRWNNNYTIFGQVVSGQDVEVKINRKPLIGEKPAEKVMLNRVTILRVP